MKNLSSSANWQVNARVESSWGFSSAKVLCRQWLWKNTQGREGASRADQRGWPEIERGEEKVELGQLRLVSVVKFNLTCDSNATNSYTQWQSRRARRGYGRGGKIARVQAKTKFRTTIYTGNVAWTQKAERERITSAQALNYIECMKSFGHTMRSTHTHTGQQEVKVAQAKVAFLSPFLLRSSLWFVSLNNA